MQHSTYDARHDADTTTEHRVSIREAAEILQRYALVLTPYYEKRIGSPLIHSANRFRLRGSTFVNTAVDVTSDAIRARLRRGTLRKEIGPKGETIVVIDADTMPPVGDTTQHDTDTTHPTADYVAAVEKQVEILRSELAARNQELSEMRRLLAGALERIPAIEPPPDTPSEPRESPQKPSGNGGGARPHPRSRRSALARASPGGVGSLALSPGPVSQPPGGHLPSGQIYPLAAVVELGLVQILYSGGVDK